MLAAIKESLMSVREQLDACARSLAEVASIRRSAHVRSKAAQVDRIVDLVGAEFGIHPDAILGKERTANTCEARFAVYWLARTTLDWSFEQIAVAMRRDHGAVHHGCGRMENLLATEPKTRARMDRLSAALRDHALNT